MTTNVLEYLERAAEKFPDKIAFRDLDSGMTWKETMEAAKRVGSWIAKRNIKSAPVAVVTTHSLSCILMFFGIVYSGNFYVPMDAKQPKKRISAMLETARPKLLLVPSDEYENFREYGKETLLCREEDLWGQEADLEVLQHIRREHLDVNPLYLMFTSGSTGVPKGVLVGHNSVIDLVEQFQKVFAFQEGDVFANQAPFDFDVSVKDIYCTLKNAATMCIVPQKMFSMPAKLASQLNEWRVSVLIWAVSAFHVLSTMKALDGERPAYLKKIFFSGEVMPAKALQYWQERIPHASYVNLYGPTEITCNCTYYKLEKTSDGKELPIGRPFPNTKILLLKENGEEAAPQEEGEICVGGVCLAKGYYNNREATEKAFTMNPLQPHYPERIYHTGDFGRYNHRGELVFTSRKDWQIKHMGHRIELSEIEQAAGLLEEVENCCCMYDKKHEKIVLVYQSEQPCERQIAKGLLEMLPKYMCPNRYGYMKKMPINARGKLDREFLRRTWMQSQEPLKESALYQEAWVIGTGSLPLACAQILQRKHIGCRICDMGRQPSLLERQAARQGISYWQGTKQELEEALLEIRRPVLVVSAINPWIFPEKVLENPYLEIINCHQALLPSHKGRNAEMWSIYERDAKSGITWHRVSAEIDGGDILLQKEIALTRHTTAIGLFRQQVAAAAEGFAQIAEDLLHQTAESFLQGSESGVMHHSQEVPNDGELDMKWEFEQLSAFLRAMDYGGLEVVKKPYVRVKDRTFFWRHYQIEEAQQKIEGRKRNVQEKQEIRLLRPEGTIVLKEVYENGGK